MPAEGLVTVSLRKSAIIAVNVFSPNVAMHTAVSGYHSVVFVFKQEGWREELANRATSIDYWGAAGF